MRVICFLWSFVVGVELVRCANLCPPTEKIDPCGCVSDGTNVRLDCIGVTSLPDARKAISSLSELQNVNIDFLLARFQEPIPSDLFSGIKVRWLSFTNCKLKGIGDQFQPAFAGLENTLEDLTVTFSFPEEEGLKYLNLSNLQALEQLQIEGNHIDALTDDFFKDGPKNVHHLYIMTNFIKKLGKNVFANLDKLQSVWLINNQFSVLERSMFPRPAQQLTSLDLTNNKISHLPEDIFADMPVLGEVILDENQIQTLPESTWSAAWKHITRLYLKENPLKCDASIEWMFKLRRPNLLKGTCDSPADKKGKELKRIIDDNYVPEDGSSEGF